MQLNLRLLKQMHPLLPATTAAEYLHRSAIALQRRGHEPEVDVMVMIEAEDLATATLDWDIVDPVAGIQLDRHRVTEDAAEAIALVLSSVVRGWTVEKRLQRWQLADWLLVAPDGQRVALEVSGIDGPFDRRRLKEKLQQVGEVKFCRLRFVSIVAFQVPETALVGV